MKPLLIQIERYTGREYSFIGITPALRMRTDRAQQRQAVGTHTLAAVAPSELVLGQ